MKKNSDVSKYIRTFTFTLIAILIAIGVVQLFLFLHIRHGAFVVSHKITLKKEVKTEVIEQLIDEEKNDPQNYIINLNLAEIYKQNKNYAEAEKEYLKAIKKTNGRNTEIIMKLAVLYIEQEQYDKAVALIEGASALSQKRSIKLKNDFYKIYADKLFEAKKYREAIDAYYKTIYYRSKVQKKPNISDILNNMMDTYIALSREAIDDKNFDAALNYINNALVYKQTPELYYKLAILYMNKDLKKSVEYFEKTRLLNPSLINFKLYEKALFELQEQEFKQGNEDQSAIYTVKLRTLQKYVQTTFTYPEEFQIVYDSAKVEVSPFARKKTLDLEFHVQNVTTYPINNLYMNIEIMDNNKTIFESRYTVSTLKNQLAPMTASPIYKIRVNIPRGKKHDVVCKVYLTKNTKIPLTLMSTQEIDIEKLISK